MSENRAPVLEKIAECVSLLERADDTLAQAVRSAGFELDHFAELDIDRLDLAGAAEDELRLVEKNAHDLAAAAQEAREFLAEYRTGLLLDRLNDAAIARAACEDLPPEPELERDFSCPPAISEGDEGYPPDDDEAFA